MRGAFRCGGFAADAAAGVAAWGGFLGELVRDETGDLNVVPVDVENYTFAAVAVFGLYELGFVKGFDEFLGVLPACFLDL